MEDARIVDLYWQRDESALAETESKYGRFCFSIANNILRNDEDAQECVNDTLLSAWNAIPPTKPQSLSAFLGEITRRLSLKKWREKTAGKRGGGQVPASLDELENLVPSGRGIDENLADEEFAELIRAFLTTLPVDERRVFLRRYWFFDSVHDIAQRFRFSENKVKSMLKRTRDKLAAYLTNEGVWI